MPRYRIRHSTLNRYHRPVRPTPHWLMVRPRDSHDLRLLEARLTIAPVPVETRWMHDVFGNSVAVLDFVGNTDRVEIVSELLIEHFGQDRPRLALAPEAERLPVAYDEEELPDLAPCLARRDGGPGDGVDAWARRFLAGDASAATQPLLEAICAAIGRDLAYAERVEPGVQTAAETLALGGGTCRDFALLMMEAARALGIAARFVSGYLYDPAADPGAAATGATVAQRGAGATHAWTQVYLPGAGWIEFDPTNGLVGGANLFRVAVARAPEQAIPILGGFLGDADDIASEDVEVMVEQVA
jgi:transglutaminase-like putative cysteine protease